MKKKKTGFKVNKKKNNFKFKEFVQISLFDNAENEIINKLNNIDISIITPLDALNYLNELKRLANG